MKEKLVYILQRVLPQYRVPLIEILRKDLEHNHIKFKFVYGQSNSNDYLKKDTINLTWGKEINNIYFFNLVFQPVNVNLFKADLIIVEQANKLILNYILLFLKPFFKYKIAFWGHGFCHQQKRNTLSNKFKFLMINMADWWFGYTESVSEWLVECGVKKEKITVLQNAIDTNGIKRLCESITENEIIEKKRRLNIPEDSPVSVFCGSMYKEKGLDFLLESCKLVSEKIPGFRLILIGSGPDSNIVQNVIGENEGVIYVGPHYGREKVLFMKMSKLFLMPGAVGLSILDSFSLGIPFITTENNYHGPEISYLKNGVNGFITPADIRIYSTTLIDLLMNEEKRKVLAINAFQTGNEITIEKMAENFETGIYKCLDLEKKS